MNQTHNKIGTCLFALISSVLSVSSINLIELGRSDTKELQMRKARLGVLRTMVQLGWMGSLFDSYNTISQLL